MGLAFETGIGDQGIRLEPLGVAEYGAGHFDRVVKGKFVDDIDRGAVELGQPLCKLCAGHHFDLIRKPTDHLPERPYLVVAVAAGDHEIGSVAQRPQAAFSRSARNRVIDIP